MKTNLNRIIGILLFIIEIPICTINFVIQLVSIIVIAIQKSLFWIGATLLCNSIDAIVDGKFISKERINKIYKGLCADYAKLITEIMND